MFKEGAFSGVVLSDCRPREKQAGLGQYKYKTVEPEKEPGVPGDIPSRLCGPRNPFTVLVLTNLSAKPMSLYREMDSVLLGRERGFSLLRWHLRLSERGFYVHTVSSLFSFHFQFRFGWLCFKLKGTLGNVFLGRFPFAIRCGVFPPPVMTCSFRAILSPPLFLFVSFLRRTLEGLRDGTIRFGYKCRKQLRMS